MRLKRTTISRGGRENRSSLKVVRTTSDHRGGGHRTAISKKGGVGQSKPAPWRQILGGGVGKKIAKLHV